MLRQDTGPLDKEFDPKHMLFYSEIVRRCNTPQPMAADGLDVNRRALDHSAKCGTWRNASSATEERCVGKV